MNKKKKNRRRKRNQNKLKLRKMRKLRNQIALAAIFQPGIKTHPDQKKEQNKVICRKKVKESEDG